MQKTTEPVGWPQKNRTESEEYEGAQTFMWIEDDKLGIYLVHYFVVGLGYAIADALAIPISIKIPITAIIVFVICWAFVSLCYRITPKSSKWIFG